MFETLGCYFNTRVCTNVFFSLHPGDLFPFTRKPLFIIVDSTNSTAYKVRHQLSLSISLSHSHISSVIAAFCDIMRPFNIQEQPRGLLYK